MVGSILIVGALTRCALIHSMCDSKTAQNNMQCNLIGKLAFHEFELGHYAVEAAKNFVWKVKAQLITEQN